MMTQREFAGRAVTMGILILIAGFVLTAAVMGAFIERSAGVLAVSAVIALGCFLLAVRTWRNAPEDEEGDDLFSGRKGLLLTLLIVYVLTFSIAAGWTLTNHDAWRGFLDGWNK